MIIPGKDDLITLWENETTSVSMTTTRSRIPEAFGTVENILWTMIESLEMLVRSLLGPFTSPASAAAAQSAMGLSKRHAFIGSSRSIDARSIVTLIVFLLVNVLVIFPLRIPLPMFISSLSQRILVKLRLREPQDGLRPQSPVQTSTPTDNRLPANEEPEDGTEGHPDELEGDSTPQEANTIQTPPRGSQTVEEPPKPTDRERSGNETAVRWYFPLGLGTSPVIGVLLLLASTCIPGSVVRDGIVGTGGVRPYDIMTLFISFAYISISLDKTGLLRYLAFLVASRSSSSGTLLYSAFYIFFGVTGLLIGNDPLILSGTPFLAYFTSHASIDPPTSYLFTHFQVSNLVSALLVSSNPTNLVLTSAFGISFLSYSAWLALPTVAAVIILYPYLRFWLFRTDHYIPRKLNPPKVDAKAALKDPWGGIFGAGLFIVTIVLLVGLSAGGKLEGVEGVWTVTAPAALVMLTRDAYHDLYGRKRRAKQLQKEVTKVKEADLVEKTGPAEDEATQPAEDGATQLTERLRQIKPEMTRDGADEPAESSSTVVAPEKKPQELALDVAEKPHGSASHARTPVKEDKARPNPKGASGTQTPGLAPPDPEPHIPLFRPIVLAFPGVSSVISRLPLPLLPFAFSMFILVEALQYTGWIRVFGKWWASWAKVGGVAGSVWLMGTIGVLGCNVFGTNIGATILLSRVLQQWQSTHSPVSPRTLYGAVFALAVGSNFGAYSFVFSASLAGLLWRTILGDKGIVMRQLEFARWNWMSMVVTMIVGLLVVAGEVCVMYKS